MGRHKKPKHPNGIWWIVFIVFCVFCYLVYKEYGNVFLKTTTTTNATTSTTKASSITYTTRTTKDEQDKYIVNISYPYFKINFVDNNIKNFIDSSIVDFKNDIKDYEVFNDNKNSLDIFFEPYLISSNFISLKFVTSIYTGGAHGNQIITSKNFDLNSNREVGLKDLFKKDGYLNLLSQKAITKFINDKTSDSAWLAEGAGPKYINFKDFTYSTDNQSFVFHFDPYQIAPYSSGMPVFEILKTDLNEYLK